VLNLVLFADIASLVVRRGGGDGSLTLTAPAG